MLKKKLCLMNHFLYESWYKLLKKLVMLFKNNTFYNSLNYNSLPPYAIVI